MARSLAADGRWRAWLAERDGRAVGNVWLQLIEKLPNPVGEAEGHGYLSNVYVVPAERGRGTGRALLEAALAYCDAVPVHDVILWPSERSRPLYLRAGFRASDAILSRRSAPRDA